MLNQRFGIELEYNSFSEKSEENQLPLGMLEVAEVLMVALNKTINISKWHTTSDNDSWIVKPDSSCGFEVCSPIFKSENDLKELKDAIKAIRKSGIFKSDRKCSFHVHFELNNTSNNYLANLIVSWIRCELFFFTLLPNYRKQTNYAQILSLCPLFFCKNDSDNILLTEEMIINNIKDYKFYSINLYHFKKSNRNTVEFRIMDSSACLNEEYAFYYIVLLNKFMEECNSKNYFLDSVLDNSYLEWLEVQDVFDFLKIKKNSKIYNFCKTRFYNYSLDNVDLNMSSLKNIFNIYNDSVKKYFEK